METIKFNNFVGEPIGEKDVAELPGITQTYNQRLENLGYDQAYMVLGQFLVMLKNEEDFQDWLKLKIGMKER
jgi:hypothetical protein